MLVLPLATASCKVRAGPPGDDAADILNAALYAAVVPLQTVARPAVPDPTLLPTVHTPDYALRFARPGVVPASDLAPAPSPATSPALSPLSLPVAAACVALGAAAALAAVRLWGR